MDDEAKAEALLAEAAAVIMEEGIAEAEIEAVIMTEEEALKETTEEWGRAVLRAAVAAGTADEVELAWTPGARPIMVK